MNDIDWVGVDALLAIGRADAQQAGTLAEHARTLRRMSTAIGDRVDVLRETIRTLFCDENGDGAAWTGRSARMMHVELSRLLDAVAETPDVLAANAATLDGLASIVGETLIEVDTASAESTGGDVERARAAMRTATAGYLDAALSLREPTFYNGLRRSSPDPVRATPVTAASPVPIASAAPVAAPGPVATPESGVSPGPIATQDAPVRQNGAPALQSAPTIGATLGPAAAPTSASPVPPHQPLAPVVPSVIGARPAAWNPTSVGVPTPRSVTPPVLGSRRGTNPGRTVAPTPRATVPSVIGGRVSVAPSTKPVSAAPGPNARPVSPSVIGARPTTSTPARASTTTHIPDTTAPGRPASPTTRPSTSAIVSVRPTIPTVTPSDTAPPTRTPTTVPTTTGRPDFGAPGRPSTGPPPPTGPKPSTPEHAVTPRSGGTAPSVAGETRGAVPTRPAVVSDAGRALRSPGGPTARHFRPPPSMRHVDGAGRWTPSGPRPVVIARPMPGEILRTVPETPVEARPRRRPSALPGRRVPVRRGRGRRVAEQAIFRGSWRRRTRRRPGQEVFGAKETPPPPPDASGAWLDPTPTVRPVIGRHDGKGVDGGDHR